MAAFEKIVTSEGHLIDPGLMRQIFDAIISDGGEFQKVDEQNPAQAEFAWLCERAGELTFAKTCLCR